MSTTKTEYVLRYRWKLEAMYDETVYPTREAARLARRWLRKGFRSVICKRITTITETRC